MRPRVPTRSVNGPPDGHTVVMTGKFA